MCIRSFNDYFTECPESVNVTIKQAEKLSNLDDEAVELICVISGVTREEIEYYWWLIDATYTPIYTFSVIISYYLYANICNSEVRCISEMNAFVKYARYMVNL